MSDQIDKAISRLEMLIGQLMPVAESSDGTASAHLRVEKGGNERSTSVTGCVKGR